MRNNLSSAFIISTLLFLVSCGAGSMYKEAPTNQKISIACKIGTNTASPYHQTLKLNSDFVWDGNRNIWVWWDKTKDGTLSTSGDYRFYTPELGLELGKCNMP